MWNEDDNSIKKEFKFDDFKSALNFVNKIGDLAEKNNHHPDVALSYGKVEITLSTHSEGKVTQKDSDMARDIDALFTR